MSRLALFLAQSHTTAVSCNEFTFPPNGAFLPVFTWHRVALSPIALTNSGTPGRTWSEKPPVFTSMRPRKSYIHSLDLSLSPAPPTRIIHWEFGKTIGARLWETKPVKEEMMSQTICLPSSPPSASNANTFVSKSATHLRPLEQQSRKTKAVPSSCLMDLSDAPR